MTDTAADTARAAYLWLKGQFLEIEETAREAGLDDVFEWELREGRIIGADPRYRASVIVDRSVDPTPWQRRLMVGTTRAPYWRTSPRNATSSTSSARTAPTGNSRWHDGWSCGWPQRCHTAPGGKGSGLLVTRTVGDRRRSRDPFPVTAVGARGTSTVHTSAVTGDHSGERVRSPRGEGLPA